MLDWIAQALKGGAAAGGSGFAGAAANPDANMGFLSMIRSALSPSGGGDPTSAGSWAANTQVYEPKGLLGQFGIETTADQRKAMMEGTSQAIKDFTKGATESPFQRAPAAAPPPNAGPQMGATGMNALMSRMGRPTGGASPFQPAGGRGIWG